MLRRRTNCTPAFRRRFGYRRLFRFLAIRRWLTLFRCTIPLYCLTWAAVSFGEYGAAAQLTATPTHSAYSTTQKPEQAPTSEQTQSPELTSVPVVMRSHEAAEEIKPPTSHDNRPPGKITFNEQIAPIIHQHCASCHRPEQVGPFSLLTYEQVKKRGQTIKAVVNSGYMPPWHPSDRSPQFAHSRQLTAEQKSLIQQWVDQDCPEGSPDQKPKLPEFQTEWMLGPPDLIVTMPRAFTVPADGPDVYRSFVLPVNLPEDRWIKAIELRPQARGAVHHALFFVDAERQARTREGKDGQAGIPGMGFLNVGGGANLRGGDSNDQGLPRLNGLRNRSRGESGVAVAEALGRGLGGYVPGTMPARLPGDLALFLPAGSDIIMQTHFHPTGKVEHEQAHLGLYFADRPPTKQLVPIQVPAMFGFGKQIDIPAGTSRYEVTDEFELPVDAEAITVGGHAHYLCREMKLEAKLPDGTTQLLLEITDWDLDWQDRYTFREPITLPVGTRLRTEIIYDNSADNPRNPYDPPRRVRWGRESNDEMGSITLQVVAADESQREKISAALGQYINRSLFERFSPGQSIADRILQLDENKDGALDRSEAPPRLSGRLFDRLDSDRDGRLDQNELQNLRQLAEQLGLPWDRSSTDKDHP